VKKSRVSRVTESPERVPESPGRRKFLRGIGAAGAAAMASATLGTDWLHPRDAGAAQSGISGGGGIADGASAAMSRRDEAFELRMQAASNEKNVPIPAHPTNGDETLYPNRIGNFSKGLPHDSLGEVDATAYRKFLKAVTTGEPADFEAIPIGGNVRLIDPQAGLAFDVEGTDSHQMAIPAAPAAIADLNARTDFRGPKVSGAVTAGTLFRGFCAGDLIGPYVSQFFFPTLQYGAAEVVQKYQTYLPVGGGGTDYLIDMPHWLKAQNGQGPFGGNIIDSNRRYLRNGRDLSAYVHVDVLFEAYFNACIYLIDVGAPLNPGNPYLASTNQTGFGTFGAPHLKTIVAEVATRALKAVWYQKWMVHRALRPEAYGGLVHMTLAGTKSYPVHSDILNSDAVQQTFSRNGTYFLPMAFPEGCPQHPSYGAGHATVAGACSTIVKAFFDENWVVPNPVVASDDGLSLVPYTGSDANQMTLGGEMNKIAANVAISRNHAGVHWRSDYAESLLLGEAVAISVLRDGRKCYNETFNGFTFTKFDGTQIAV
jgi:membrane-associated phospholipid phosphatase